jgi:GNAT superfamily N-acetyltransferase
MPLLLTPLEDFEAAQRDGTLWVARDEHGAPVGFALVERLGAEFHLEEMDVLPEHGRRGIGTALVRAVCDWAARKGSASVTLCTFRDIPWNAPFYQRLGFRSLDLHELPPALRERMREEAEHGLTWEHRVAMRYTPPGVPR